MGFLFARLGCDASDCSGTYLKYMAVMGGIGATVGVFIDAHPSGLSPPRRGIHTKPIDFEYVRFN